MRVLITGAAGRLGRQLIRQLADTHDLITTDLVGRVDFAVDLSDFHACRRLIHDCTPEIVLHAAAWTDVDGCALDPQQALRVNGLATAHLAALTSACGIPFSTSAATKFSTARWAGPTANMIVQIRSTPTATASGMANARSPR